MNEKNGKLIPNGRTLETNVVAPGGTIFADNDADDDDEADGDNHAEGAGETGNVKEYTVDSTSAVQYPGAQSTASPDA